MRDIALVTDDVSSITVDKVRTRHCWPMFICEKRPFYQDSLETNIGKALKKERCCVVFLSQVKPVVTLGALNVQVGEQSGKAWLYNKLLKLFSERCVTSPRVLRKELCAMWLCARGNALLWSAPYQRHVLTDAMWSPCLWSPLTDE
jgi:hypothetical protein